MLDNQINLLPDLERIFSSLSEVVLRSSARYILVTAALVLLSGEQLFGVDSTVPNRNGLVAAADPDRVYDQVFQLFESGHIDDAEHLALKMLDTRSDLSDFDRGLLHEVLAFCAIANNDEQNGIRQFVEALQLNPGITPDPITWSPKMRNAYNQAFVEYLKLAERKRHFRSALEASLCRKAAVKSTYLPGAGQLLKGQKRRGTSLGVAFWGSTAFFLFSQAVLSLAADDYREATTPDVAARKWLEYRDANRVATVAGVLTLSLYIYTFADALWTVPSSELELSSDE